jgi:DNA-binding MarR family transcriptional regulator
MGQPARAGGAGRGGGRAEARLEDAALAHDLGFLLARARVRTSSAANDALAELGLRVRAFSVLWLASEGLQPSQRELGAFLALDPSQVVAIVDDLESRGLVERQQDPADRRSRIIVARPAGRRLLADAVDAVDRANERSLAPLDEEEQVRLRELLAKLVLTARSWRAP